jgi:hypothetical protein
MSALTVPFLMPRVEEVVPDYAMLKDRLTGSSVVEERYTATQVPSSGDSYSVGGSGTKLMIIRVANQNDYIDTSTMVLSFFAKANTTSQSAIDDHVFSCIDTINVKVGGQTVEVLNNVGHLANALVQGSMPLAYYKQNGAFEGLYAYDKWADTQGILGATSVTGVGGPPLTSVTTTFDDVMPGSAPKTDNCTMLKKRWDVGNSWLDVGRYYAVPLTMLGICRIPTLFAARNFQDVTIEILFRSSVAGAVWCKNPVDSNAGNAGSAAASAAWAATGSIGISDVQLTYDCCRMSADYYALMDQELKMPNGSGVAYPIDTYQVQPASIPSASFGSGTALTSLPQPGLTRIVVAKGTRFLKGVYGVTKNASSESSVLWRNNSSAGNFGFNSYQVIINSKRYPQLQVQTSAQAFQELQKAYNQLGSIAAGSPISWFTYVGHPFFRSQGAISAYGAGIDADTKQDGTVGNQQKAGTTLGAYPGDEAMFQLGVNLEQFLTNQPDAGGINTSTSGYQIAVELGQLGISGDIVSSSGGASSSPGTFSPTNLTHYVILHFTRVLTLKAGAVEILD